MYMTLYNNKAIITNRLSLEYIWSVAQETIHTIQNAFVM